VCVKRTFCAQLSAAPFEQYRNDGVTAPKTNGLSGLRQLRKQCFPQQRRNVCADLSLDISPVRKPRWSNSERLCRLYRSVQRLSAVHKQQQCGDERIRNCFVSSCHQTRDIRSHQNKFNQQIASSRLIHINFFDILIIDLNCCFCRI